MMPTESFLPQMKYASVITLPTTDRYQNPIGITTRFRRLVAYSCTNQRAVNRHAPSSPISFQGVSVRPWMTRMTSFMACDHSE